MHQQLQSNIKVQSGHNNFLVGEPTSTRLQCNQLPLLQCMLPLRHPPNQKKTEKNQLIKYFQVSIPNITFFPKYTL
jgi:hypothetical protein